jgi:hypothetical protein
MVAGGSTINTQPFVVEEKPPENTVFEEKLQQPEAPVSEDPTDQINLKFLAFLAVVLASIADGLYYSLSMLKFGCEVDTESFTGIEGDSKFDNLTNNWGQHKAILIAFLVLIPTTILLSILSAKKLNLSEKVQKLWPYVRSALSGLKNGRKAVVSTAFIAQAFAHSTRFYRWANPIGVGVGLLCMANAIWLRRMEEERDSFIKENQNMVVNLNKIKDLTDLGERPTALRHNRLKQSAICTAVFGDGLTDGIYLYACLFGVVGLSTVVFPPALLIAATVTVVVLTTVSIISKLHAEYKKSCELEQSAINVDIAYLEKKQRLSVDGLNAEEKIELASLKEKQEKLTKTVNSDNKSFLFSTGRQTVMGFKNAAAAGAVLAMLPFVDLAAETAFILAKVAGFFYALFLAGEEVKKYNASTERGKNKDLNLTENENLIAVDSSVPQKNEPLATEIPAHEMPKEAIGSKASVKKSLSIVDSVRNLFFSPKPEPEKTSKKVKPMTDFFSKKTENGNGTIPLITRSLSFSALKLTNPIPYAC